MAAIERGFEVIAGTRSSLRAADPVLVSDCEDDPGPAAGLRARAAERA